MERVYAFIDEYGAFGWDITNPTVSTHFIITAVIVKESDLEEYKTKTEALRQKHFQTGEIKSSGIGKKHDRRIRILQDIKDIPFGFFSVVIDKQKCLDNMTIRGLNYKRSFYKFMNNIVHSELQKAFAKITVITDEMIDNDYMKSFSDYFYRHQDISNLFGEGNFIYKNSKTDSGLQLSDLISGTLAYQYDTHKKAISPPDFSQYLDEKKIRIELYPKSFEDYTVEDSAVSSEYDKDIAKICFDSTVTFINNNQNKTDDETKAQVLTLKHLLFRFMNNSSRGYIYTNELLEVLDNAGIRFSETTFRMQVIGKLRDKGIIIASSQKGYKIPSKKQELFDYINHDAKIVIPMLSRLQKCRDLIKLGTLNELDLLDSPEYASLKAFFDNNQ